MNEINKRYNIGLSIINNNQGVKAMLNNIIKPSRIIKSYKIFNRLKSIINKVLENVGYFFIGYKVDIEQNQSDILEAKAKIRILRNTQSHNIEDIQALKKYVSKKFVKIELHMANTEQIKTLTKDVEVLKDTINILRKHINLTDERGQDGTK
jgi:predicted  nucleic acid-binding Zn-ribbon protein